MSRKSIWVENTPPSLLNLSIEYCLRHLDVITDSLPNGARTLKEGLYLPLEISEAFLRVALEENIRIDDKFTHIFLDNQSSRISQITTRNSPVSDEGFLNLVIHNLKKIYIDSCQNLTTKSLESINDHSDNLLSLHVENSDKIFPDYLSDISGDEDEDDLNSIQESIYEKRRYILKAPRLKQLTLRDLNIVQGRNYFNILCKALPNLSHLDLSGCGLLQSHGLQKLQFLLNCPHLVSLILYNVKEVRYSLKTLCKLGKLEHLDISQIDKFNGGYEDEEFEQPTRYLEELVLSLPRLRSLDISGTNLAADYSVLGGRCDGTLCDIPGLCSRIDSPLEFLGLYKTLNDDASRREHIPALTIAGSSTEEQLLVAGRHYADRQHVMASVLGDLINVVSGVQVDRLEEIMDITLAAAIKFPTSNKIQNLVVIMMYYLLPLVQDKANYNVLVKKRVLGVMLGIMERNKGTDSMLVKHSFMVLWRMKIPEDLMCAFERTVDMLLATGEHYSNQDMDEYIQKSVVHMLNTLVCHIFGDVKKQVGIRVIDSMLNVVRSKVTRSVCDEILEVAWSVMWNVTDETEENSQRFLDRSGMELFLECKKKFGEKLDLLKNMMGLLGNVAEVKSCRRRLMTSQFIEEFSFLLDSGRDGIEVSYNAAGVLAHIASDGPEVWTIETPVREHVLERLERAVNRWDINTKRNINYRSLAPIISLLGVEHTPECQLWAAWAVANLTLFDEDKYCPLVEEEGGLAAITRIMEAILRESLTSSTSSKISGRLLELGQKATHNINEHKKRMSMIERCGNTLVLLEVNDSASLPASYLIQRRN